MIIFYTKLYYIIRNCIFNLTLYTCIYYKNQHITIKLISITILPVLFYILIYNYNYMSWNIVFYDFLN